MDNPSLAKSEKNKIDFLVSLGLLEKEDAEYINDHPGEVGTEDLRDLVLDNLVAVFENSGLAPNGFLPRKIWRKEAKETLESVLKASRPPKKKVYKREDTFVSPPSFARIGSLRECAETVGFHPGIIASNWSRCRKDFTEAGGHRICKVSAESWAWWIDEKIDKESAISAIDEEMLILKQIESEDKEQINKLTEAKNKLLEVKKVETDRVKRVGFSDRSYASRSNLANV